jgi:hypothetical protein
VAGIKDYSTTQANNTSLNSINVGEGMLPSNLNNAIRALMKNTREWFNDSQWVEYGDGDGAYTAAYASATSFTIAGVDVSAIYHEGRRIKLIAPTPGTIYGTISSSSFSTDTTINVTWDSGSLSNEAITNVYIGALSKTNNSLPTGVIATATLADGSVTTVKIADSAVTTAKINDAAVTNAKLGADSVNGSKIADDSIDSEHYVDGSIDTAHIADSQITTAKIANSNVTTAKIADSNVTTAKLASNAVTTVKITDSNVTTAKIAADAIDGTKIADDSINSEHYVDGSIDTQHIADSQITTAKIADSNVTTAKIADSNVTTAKINDDAVTAAKIADAVIVTNSEQSTHTPDDVTFFTTSASDGRYFRQDSSETIDSGDTWSGSDAFIATTAAIDARVIDLVDDVGGFFPIANETSFPNTNPDVNDGAGTIVSIKEIATTRTPSGGTVTISGGTVGGSTVTITGCGSTVLTAGFGVLVETSTTLNTYTFHRLVPKATEVTTVASISSDITTVAGDTVDIGVVSSISSDIQTLADIEDGTTATNAISNVGNNISSVTTTATNIASVNNFANVYRISSSAPTTSLDLGDLYFDTTVNELKVYGSSGWQAAGSSVNGTSQRYNYTATSGQTTFTGSDNNGNTLTYDAGYIDVYLNGVKLLNGTDVTVTSGTSVVLASGATTGDVVDIVAYGTFSVASLNADNLDSGTVPDARITGAYTGITNLTMSGTLTVGDGHTIGNDGTFDNLLIQSSTGENIEYNSGLGSHIFKQNGTEVFRIDDTTGRVGIGLSNPTRPLTVFHSTLPILSLHNNTTGQNADDGFQFQLSSDDGYVWNYESAGNVIFGAGGAEAMRIDSSGNLLVGKTSDSFAGEGLVFSPGSASSITRDDGNVISIRRDTSDGDIIKLYKDTTNVGSIGAIGGTLSIGTGDTGIRFNDGGDNIFAFNTSTSSTRDNAVDLGASGGRWKDLYLGGGLYVGGTGSANNLDDYEEGTFTPGITGNLGAASGVNFTTRVGAYTKVGRAVFFHINIVISSWSSGPSGGTTIISGLPFTNANVSGNTASISIGRTNGFSSTSAPQGGYIQENESRIILQTADGSDARSNMTTSVNTSTLSGDENIKISGHYYTA